LREWVINSLLFASYNILTVPSEIFWASACEKKGTIVSPEKTKYRNHAFNKRYNVNVSFTNSTLKN